MASHIAAKGPETELKSQHSEGDDIAADGGADSADALAPVESGIVYDEEFKEAAQPDTPRSTDLAAVASGDVARRQSAGRAVVVALVVLVAILATLAVLVGWLGYRVYQDREAQGIRTLMTEVAKQGALNLTTIDYNTIDSDVKRILDSSTGAFHSDFEARVPAFTDFVKTAQSKTSGTVTAAGLEAQEGDEARVLVLLSVKTAAAGTPDSDGVRAWRLRVTVQRDTEGGAKVSNVEFVP